MGYNLNEPISKYFFIGDVLRSDTATKNNIKEQFEPSIDIINNAKEFATKLLDPLCEYLEYVPRINSWYRCNRVNRIVGGVENSQHLDGFAVDFNDIYGNYSLEEKIKKSGLPFDQLINENNGKWLHLSYSRKPRKMNFPLKKII